MLKKNCLFIKILSLSSSSIFINHNNNNYNGIVIDDVKLINVPQIKLKKNTRYWFLFLNPRIKRKSLKETRITDVLSFAN